MNRNSKNFYGIEQQLDTQSNYDRNVNKFFDEPKKNKTLADTFLNLQSKVENHEEPKKEVDPGS